MATQKQKETAKEHSAKHIKPGSQGKGDYYQIQLRSKAQFEKFRILAISDSSHQRVAGRTKNGTWLTQKWLIDKDKAYIDEKGCLIGKDEGTKNILEKLGKVPHHEKGNRFKSKPSQDTPEKAKSTKAQQQAKLEKDKPPKAQQQAKPKKDKPPKAQQAKPEKDKPTKAQQAKLEKDKPTKARQQPKPEKDKSTKAKQQPKKENIKKTQKAASSK